LNRFNPAFTFRLEELKSVLNNELETLSEHSHEAAAAIYQQLIRQATSMAFNDAFFIQTLLFLGLIGLLWIIRKPPIGKRKATGAH
jgi:DHA2 family multidrug resistance protein